MSDSHSNSGPAKAPAVPVTPSSSNPAAPAPAAAAAVPSPAASSSTGSPSISAPMPAARLVVIFTGRVQGVGFRKTTAYLAKEFRVRGYVRNEPDGAVRLDIEGDSDELQRFWQVLENRMRLFIDHRDIFTPNPRGKFSDFHIAHHPGE